MKIAIVIEHFNPARGGAETYTVGLVQWLCRKGHEVTIFTQDWVAEPTGVTMVAVPVKGISAARRYLSFSTEASQLVAGGASTLCIPWRAYFARTFSTRTAAL